MIVHYHNILSVVEFPLVNADVELFNDDVIFQYCEASTLDEILVVSCTEVGCMLLPTVDDILVMSCTEVGYMLLSTVDDILAMPCIEVGYILLSTVGDILVMSCTEVGFVPLSITTYDTENNMIYRIDWLMFFI